MHETEALHIRRLTAEDLEPLHRLLSDPAVMRYLEPPFTRAQTEAFLQRAGMGREPLIWAVEASQPLISMTVTSCPFMDR